MTFSLLTLRVTTLCMTFIIKTTRITMLSIMALGITMLSIMTPRITLSMSFSLTTLSPMALDSYFKISVFRPIVI
jgi:hypothetical protein